MPLLQFSFLCQRCFHWKLQNVLSFALDHAALVSSSIILLAIFEKLLMKVYGMTKLKYHCALRLSFYNENRVISKSLIPKSKLVLASILPKALSLLLSYSSWSFPVRFDSFILQWTLKCSKLFFVNASKSFCHERISANVVYFTELIYFQR